MVFPQRASVIPYGMVASAPVLVLMLSIRRLPPLRVIVTLLLAWIAIFFYRQYVDFPSPPSLACAKELSQIHDSQDATCPASTGNTDTAQFQELYRDLDDMGELLSAVDDMRHGTES